MSSRMEIIKENFPPPPKEEKKIPFEAIKLF
jgi:hypothetical protein